MNKSQLTQRIGEIVPLLHFTECEQLADRLLADYHVTPKLETVAREAGLKAEEAGRSAGENMKRTANAIRVEQGLAKLVPTVLHNTPQMWSEKKLREIVADEMREEIGRANQRTIERQYDEAIKRLRTYGNGD